MADIHFIFDGGVCRQEGVGGPAHRRLETVLVEAALNSDEVTFVFAIPEDEVSRRVMIREALIPFDQLARTPLIQLLGDAGFRIQEILDGANSERELSLTFWMPIEGMVEWPEWANWRKHLAAVYVTYSCVDDE